MIVRRLLQIRKEIAELEEVRSCTRHFRHRPLELNSINEKLEHLQTREKEMRRAYYNQEDKEGINEYHK